jgi:hypothetical protein
MFQLDQYFQMGKSGDSWMQTYQTHSIWTSDHRNYHQLHQFYPSNARSLQAGLRDL